jgi:hypothetical protein
MSDLVERLHDLYCPDDADQRTANEAAARIEELERALENLCIHVGMGWETDGVLETARAVLEKGKQPGAAESVGEEFENVAIVTRTVKAGQGRVEGEP